jgi:hypothetical protein
MAKAEVGLSAQRIYQALVEENGFTDSYQSINDLCANSERNSPSSSKRMDEQTSRLLEMPA